MILSFKAPWSFDVTIAFELQFKGEVVIASDQLVRFKIIHLFTLGEC